MTARKRPERRVAGESVPVRAGKPRAALRGSGGGNGEAERAVEVDRAVAHRRGAGFAGERRRAAAEDGARGERRRGAGRGVLRRVAAGLCVFLVGRVCGSKQGNADTSRAASARRAARGSPSR